MQRTHFMVRSKGYSAVEQLNFLKATYKDSKGTVSRGTLVWYLDIQPLAINGTYRLKITYKMGEFPHAYIASPKPLPLAKGATKLPHTYDTKTQQLCLFYPKFREWDKTMKIAETIVHWAALWIVYYESWVLTGVWQGGGHGEWDAPKESPKM